MNYIINTNIYARVLEFINKRELIDNGDRILLSLSAGKDSIALLDILLQLKDDFSIDLAIFHLNHMTRGEESDNDEKFINEIARKYKLEIFIHKFNFKDKKPGGVSFEEFARVKRYELLDKICEEHKFNKIATAHNRDDNKETILMRIFRGTGIHGLGGIEVKRGNIIRPLLFLSAREIYSHLKEEELQWREDSSNKDNKYLRNYIRNSLLPMINERMEGAGESILSLSQISKEYSSIINDLLVEKQGILYLSERDCVTIELNRYIFDKKLFKYVISKVMRENFEEFVRTGILEEIYRKATIDKTHMQLYENKKILIKKTLKNGKKVIVISKRITYYKKKSEIWQYELDLRLCDSDSNRSVYIEEIDKEVCFKFVDFSFFDKNRNNHNLIFISIYDSNKNIQIRNRRNGDKINLENGTKKIKEILIDNKIENSAKEYIPLFSINSEIAAFMPGIIYDISNRVSVDYQVDRYSKKILAIQSK